MDVTPHLVRSISCPNFTFDVEPRDPVVKRKRANSENITLSTKDMLRIQSDTDLLGIDKEKTFTASAIVKPAELLARVVNVLGGFEPNNQDKGINLFDDEHILANESPPMFTIGQDLIHNSPMRSRALSVAVPNYRKESIAKMNPDYTWTNGDNAEKFRREANLRVGKFSLPNKVSAEPKENVPQHQPNFITRIFIRRQSSTDNPADYIKNTMKGRVSNTQIGDNPKDSSRPRRSSFFPSFFGSDDKHEADSYKAKTKRGRHSIFPTFDFNRDDDDPKAYIDQTSRGRRSLFPNFDFSEDEDAAAKRSYQNKSKRHSIFPTFDFSEDEDISAAKAYKERTKSGRHSIFPTFDFSDPDEASNRYKDNTRRGRRSIFPTFNFSGLPSNDEDTVDEDEVRRYQNKTKKGRLSLFPSFGKSNKKSDDEEVVPESSDELVDYKNKTQRGRSSLFPNFGRDRNNSSPHNSYSDLESSIRQYQNQSQLGRNSLFERELQNYRNSTASGRGSAVSNDLENFRSRTGRRRPSLFDPDININSLPEAEQVDILEHTSVADLLRALAVIETVGANGPGEPPGILDLIRDPNIAAGRRGSLKPDPTSTSLTSNIQEDPTGPRRRRISARASAPQFTPTLATVVAGAELQITATAARENRMSMLSQPPPPYTETATDEDSQKPRTRRYSPAPSDPNRPSTGPVPRLFSRIRKESGSNSDQVDSRRGSLTDVVIDNFKDKT